MTQPTVFVTRRIPEVGLELLRPHVDLRLHEGNLPPSRDELLRGARGCAGLLTLLSDRVDAEVMETAGEQLRVVSNFAVGYNNIDLEAAAARSVAVGNTPDVLTDATADIAVALLLAVARRLPEAAEAVRDGGWKTWEPTGWIGHDLVGKTLGIVGMGRIGAAVGRRLHYGWGLRVCYTARSPKPDIDQALSARHVKLGELLAESDFISLHVPLTDETRHLIGTQAFSQMRESAILINTARGEIVDQEALVEALRSRRIAAAGLDVCSPEPLPTDHPLLRMDRCLVLPHIGSATLDARDAMARRAAENLLAGLRGEPLPYPVATTRGS